MEPENFPGAEAPGPESTSKPENVPATAGNGFEQKQPRHVQGQGGGRNFRRRRGRHHRNGGANGGHHHKHGRGQGQGGRHQQNQQNSIFTGPMDHSYRQQPASEVNGNSIQPQGRQGRRFGRDRFRGFKGGGQIQGGMPVQPALEPVAGSQDATTRIFAFVDDLFFVTKMTDTARKLNVRLEFVKSFEELVEKIGEREDDKTSLVIFDLNNANAKPLVTIPKIKAKFKKGISILGFVSHVQGELKIKALEAGCDSVMPRSAFSQNLPQLLRRHGAPEELLAE